MQNANNNLLPEQLLQHIFRVYFEEIPVQYKDAKNLNAFYPKLNMYETEYKGKFLNLSYFAEKIKQKGFFFTIIDDNGHAEIELHKSNKKFSTLPKEALGLSSLDILEVKSKHH